jgi:hypothetical protein
MTDLTGIPTLEENTAGAIWDGRAEFDIGVLILRYLADSPPPEGARFAGDFEKWGTNLVRSGRGRMEQHGASPLRPVGGDA